MIKLLFALLLSLTLPLFAGSAIQKQLPPLEKELPVASRAQTVEILHTLENLYIESVIASDTPTIVRILKDMIRCQKRLGLDSSANERELRRYQKKSAPKRSAAPRASHSAPSRFAPKPKPVSRIRSIALKGDTLIIKCNRPITKEEVLHFQLPSKKSHKDIYDLRTNLYFKAPTLSIPGLEHIKIAQNRKDKVRIVLSNKRPFTTDSFLRQGTLFIRVNLPSGPAVPLHKQPVTHTSAARHTPHTSRPKPSAHPASPKVYASSKTIVIDPGHGGKDPGAIGYKRHQEKRAVLEIAKKLATILKKKGYRVYLTRARDIFIKLRERTHFANRKRADLFISIHANAAPRKKRLTLKGIETFFLSPAKTAKAKRIAATENAQAEGLGPLSKDTLLSFLNRNKIIQSNKLAIDIQGGILSSLKGRYSGIIDGGVREAPFWVLVGAQMPAVLIETGYITNPIEGDRLFNPFYQKHFAEGIARGIDNYFLKNP